jgi:hypothetical protein
VGMHIPASSAELTASWLSEALKTDVTDVEIENLGEGKGIMAEVVRVHLRGHDVPPTLVGKLPSPHPENYNTAVAYVFYRREVEFYRHIAGHLDVRTASCRYADVDDDGTNFVLLLDEIIDQRQPDQIAGLTIADTEVVLDTLAALHGHWWQSPALERLHWLPDFSFPPYRAVEAQLQQYFPAFCAMWGDRVAPEALATAEKQIHCVNLMLDEWRNDKPTTFVHYDVRGDNMMFDAEDNLTMLDWQLCLRAPAAIDVAYLLGTNLTIEDRRANEERLLQRYHGRLAELGVDYPLAHLEDDYRSSMLNVTNMFIIAALLDPGNDRGRALVQEIVLRGFQASADLDAGAYLPN